MKNIVENILLALLIPMLAIGLSSCHSSLSQNKEEPSGNSFENGTVNIDPGGDVRYDENVQSISATRTSDLQSESETENDSGDQIPSPYPSYDVASLIASQTHSQLIVVSTESYPSTSGRLCLYSRQDGNWVNEIDVPCYVGKEGIGTGSEFASKTPVGIYPITSAFGNAPDPGCTAFDYIQATEDLWWVSDSSSPHYNKMVSDLTVTDFDKEKSEHITECGYAYDYVLTIGYNVECIPDAGSAMFVHCSEGKPTEGCVSIDEDSMRELMTKVTGNCCVIIDIEQNIGSY